MFKLVLRSDVYSLRRVLRRSDEVRTDTDRRRDRHRLRSVPIVDRNIGGTEEIGDFLYQRPDLDSGFTWDVLRVSWMQTLVCVSAFGEHDTLRELGRIP